MHIMHVIDSLAVGGAERMVVEMANQTAADGYRVSVCITRNETTLGEALANGIPLFVLDRRRRWDWRAISKFIALIRDQQVNLLHVHGRHTLSFLSIVQLWRRLPIPIVWQDHHGEIEIDTSVPLWFQWLGKYCFNYYVGVSEKLGDWAKACGIAADKIAVIENGLDLQPILHIPPRPVRHELGLPADALLGVTVGGWRWEKGLDVFIEAVARSSWRDRLTILVVGGVRDPAYMQTCHALIDAHRLGDTFRFLGQRTDVISVIQGADFAVMPSRYESGPLSLIEYMACGLPLVSTTVGAIARQAMTMGIQEFVPPDNVGALAQALDRLLSLSPDDRLARGQQGLATCLEHFDIRGKMPRWYRIYEKVVGHGKGAP